MNLTILLNIGMMEIGLIALVVLLLFGGAKIPELMRGLGKGIKEFKDATNGVSNESDKTESKTEEKEEKK